MKNLKKILLAIIFVIASVCMSAFAEAVEYVPDMSGNEMENWECSEGTLLDGGILKNSWTDSKTMNITAVENEYSFKNNYTFNAKVYNSGNNDGNALLVVFNYQSDRNFYFIEFGGGGTVSFKKRVSGNDTIMEKYPEAYKTGEFDKVDLNIEITNNFATVKATRSNGEETTLFENIELSVFTYGKVGFKTTNSVMGASNISVTGEADKCLLGIKETSIQNGEKDVDFEPQLTLVFDMKLDADTVNKSAIHAECNGETMGDEMYSIDFDGDSTVTINFTEILLPKTEYKLIVDSSVHSLEYNSGMPKGYEVSFTTKPPVFELTRSQLMVRGVNVDDLSKVGGQNAVVVVKALNNELADPQDYMIALGIFESDGRLMAIKTFSGSATRGAEVSHTASIKIPEGLSETSYYKWFVWDSFAGMKQLHYTKPMIFDSTGFASVDTDIATGHVTISGKLPNGEAKRAVTILVLNPDSDASDADDAAIQNSAEIVTDAGGVFSYSFTMSESAGAVSGTYTIYIGGDDFTKNEKINFYYALPADRLNAIEDINKGAQSIAEMETKIEAYKDILAYNTDVYKNIDVTGLAERIWEYVKTSQLDPNNETAIQNFIRCEAVLTAWEQSIREVVVDKYNNILNFSLLGLDSWDENKNTTIVDFYNNKMKAEGKSKAINAILGRKIKNEEEFGKLFTEYVTIYGVTNGPDGSAHIKELLTKNASMIGLNLSKYVSSRADRLLAAKSDIDSVSKLQKYVDSLSEEPKKLQQGGGNGGGGGGSKSTIVQRPGNPLVEEPIREAINKAQSDRKRFLDMEAYAWAENAVEQLALKNVISDSEDKRFRPGDSVTRNEFTKMIITALGLNTDATECEFTDVADWAKPYICAAKEKGIVNGISDTIFGGNDNITRQDAVAIIVRAFGFAIQSENNIDFSDSDQIADYAVEAVKIALGMEIVNGYDGAFHPTEGCTRAQAAQIIYNALLKSEVK